MIEQAIYHILVNPPIADANANVAAAAASVAALAGSRVYLISAPQGEYNPRIAIQLISDVETLRDFASDIMFRTAAFQITALASTYANASTLARNAVTILEAFTGVLTDQAVQIDFINGDNLMDLPDSPLEGTAAPTVFGKTADISVQYMTVDL